MRRQRSVLDIRTPGSVKLSSTRLPCCKLSSRAPALNSHATCPLNSRDGERRISGPHRIVLAHIHIQLAAVLRDVRAPHRRKHDRQVGPCVCAVACGGGRCRLLAGTCSVMAGRRCSGRLGACEQMCGSS